MTNHFFDNMFSSNYRAQDNYSDYALERFQNLCLGLPESYSDMMIRQVLFRVL
jgi:hypothetical protein